MVGPFKNRFSWIVMPGLLSDRILTVLSNTLLRLDYYTIFDPVQKATTVLMFIRVGKTGSLGPWKIVIVYFSKLSFCQNDSPIGGHFGKRTACYNTL